MNKQNKTHTGTKQRKTHNQQTHEKTQTTKHKEKHKIKEHHMKQKKTTNPGTKHRKNMQTRTNKENTQH